VFKNSQIVAPADKKDFKEYYKQL